MKILVFVYEIILFLILIFILPFTIFHKKIKLLFLERRFFFNDLNSLKDFKGAYWFHVASHGELEQVIEILKNLKSLTNKKIVLSYFSPTAKKAIDNEKNKMGEIYWDYAFALPFDLSFFITPLIQTLKPEQFIAIHREFWPSLLYQLKKNSVPLSLINTYVTNPSKSPLFFFRLFHKICTVDEQSKEYFLRNLPHTNVQCFSDTRIDRIYDRLARYTNPSTPYQDHKINIVWASLWKEDYQQIQKCLLHSQYRHFIVPHEIKPDFIDFIQKDCKSKNLSPVSFGEKGNHVLIDKVGYLLELYSISQIAFVGGSFKAKVHSVLEPAVASNIVLTGPLIQNSIQALLLQMNHLIHVFKSSAEINDFLVKYTNKEQLLFEQNKIKQYFNSDNNPSKKVAEWLLH